MEHPDRFCLSLHAGYACRHSGACCTAGWTIPIERPAFDRVRAHIGDAQSALNFRRRGPLPEGAAAIVGVREDGACAFYESDRGRLCAIHRELGADALPSACRQFPRVVVHDPRAMRISLSHFCPSAAALLLSSSRPTIITAPPNVDLGGAVDGLDAREALPPLLQPEMLMDFDGYAAWEAHAIDVLGRDDLSSAEAIATIAAATNDLERWRPGHTPLTDAVAHAFERTRACDPRSSGGGVPRTLEDVRRVALARACVPVGLRAEARGQRPEVRGQRAGGTDPLTHPPSDLWPPPSDLWSLPPVDHVVRNYLAARLFGNWIAYYGRGLGTVVEYLRICLAVLEMEVARHSACSPVSASWQSVIEPAVRSSDLLLVHLVDAKELARRLSPSPR
jgi:Fe-S-cluster containining protein